MKLLHAIYSSPRQLLKKAGRDGAALVSAIDSQDEEAAREALFNFAVTAYHVWDWVKAYRPDLDSHATNPLAIYESLAACRDLANASKHATLDPTRGPYQKHPPVVQDVVVSVPGRTPIPAPQGNQALSWRLKVKLDSGRRLAVEDLAREALADWKKYFAQYFIT